MERQLFGGQRLPFLFPRQSSSYISYFALSFPFHILIITCRVIPYMSISFLVYEESKKALHTQLKIDGNIANMTAGTLSSFFLCEFSIFLLFRRGHLRRRGGNVDISLGCRSRAIGFAVGGYVLSLFCHRNIRIE